MAIINNAEVYFAKLDPSRPNRKYPDKPTWDIVLRTTSKMQKKEWETLRLNVKAVVPDDDSETYFQTTLRKRTVKSDGTPSGPVEVVNGDNEPVDPNTIGNGSIANIRIFQYEYPQGDTKIMKTASVLMGVQLTKHYLYIPAPRETFEKTETQVIMPTGVNDVGVDTGEEDLPS